MSISRGWVSISLALLLVSSLGGCAEPSRRSSVLMAYRADVLDPSIGQGILTPGSVVTPALLSNREIFRSAVWTIDKPSYRCNPRAPFTKSMIFSDLPGVSVSRPSGTVLDTFEQIATFLGLYLNYFEYYKFSTQNVREYYMPDRDLDAVLVQLKSRCAVLWQTDRSVLQVKRLIRGDYVLSYKFKTGIDFTVRKHIQNVLSFEFGIRAIRQNSGTYFGRKQFFAVEFKGT